MLFGCAPLRGPGESYSDVIIKLVDEGVTVLLVEQKLTFARRVGRSFCILDRGQVVAGGQISDLTRAGGWVERLEVTGGDSGDLLL